jgi:GxxExxY protein
MKVHRTLGNGFQEVVYQRCLAIEFSSMKLNFEREKYQGIYYCGVAVGRRRVDFLVEDKILVEIKAKVELDRIHLAQAIN